MDMKASPIGRAVQRLRTARGLTQDALARKARVSRIYVASLERGVRRNPSVAVVRRLARALGVPVMELLE